MDKNITISADIPNIYHDIYHDYHYNSKKQNWIFSKTVNNSDISLRHLVYLESIKELSIDEEEIEEKSQSLLFKIFKIFKSCIPERFSIIYNLKNILNFYKK